MVKPDLRQQLKHWRATAMISLEMEMLLAAVSVNFDEQVENWRQILTQNEIHWDDLLIRAEIHGLRPMLWRFLQHLDVPSMPDNLLQTLKDFVRQNALQNLGMTGELAGILNTFARHGINAIPYKGPTLALLAYGDLALREFGDLDILITPQIFPKAANQMEECDYQPQFNLETVLRCGFLKVTNVLAFMHPVKQVKVELHWQIAPPMFPFPLSQEQLWQGRQSVAPANLPMKTLTTEVLLVYLCSHGSKHWWEALEWIADVAGLINRHSDLDWKRVIELAYAAKCERSLWMGLLLVKELLNTPLPEDISHQLLEETAAQKLTEKVCEWLLLGSGTAPGMWQRCLFYAGLWKGVRDKAEFARQMLFCTTVADWQFLPLPNVLSPLYLFIRPVRLLKDRLVGAKP